MSADIQADDIETTNQATLYSDEKKNKEKKSQLCVSHVIYQLYKGRDTLEMERKRKSLF